MSRVTPAHKPHTQSSTGALVQLMPAQSVQRTRDTKPQLQLAMPPTTLEPPSGRSVRLSMARELPRPMLRPVSSDALAAIDSELASIPVEYVRQSVLGISERIYSAMASVAPKTLLAKTLPSTLDCVAQDPSVEQRDMPTHFIIVYHPRGGRQRGLLFPAHSLVLATQCSSLNRFTPTARQMSDDDTTLTVPLIGIGVPAPNSFHILNAFLYTHNHQQLLSAFLALPSGTALASISHQSTGVASRLSRIMADLLSMRALLGALKTVHGVWANAASLGVNDDRLWMSLRFAWTVLIGAVERSAGVATPHVYIVDEEVDLVGYALGDTPPPYRACCWFS